jgi:hypothetical protein
MNADVQAFYVSPSSHIVVGTSIAGNRIITRPRPEVVPRVRNDSRLLYVGEVPAANHAEQSVQSRGIHVP